MTINLMARGTTAPPLRPGHRRRLLTVPGHRRLLTVSGLAGVGYSLSWIAGLAVPAPSPGFGASGTEIVAALSGHGPAVAAQFALTEGLPAAGISGLVYLLLIAPLAAAAGPALVLLLAFMTGSGIMTGMTAGPKDR